jgi:hypothetical protein
MGITKKFEPISFDADAMCDVITTSVLGNILSRMDDGVGLNDEKMADYSDSYIAQLKRANEDTKVDHRRKGLMLSQMRESERQVLERGKEGTPTYVEVTFSIGSGGNRNNIAAFLQTIRPWFGISPNDVNRVSEALVATTTEKKTLPVKQPEGRTRDARGRWLKLPQP